MKAYLNTNNGGLHKDHGNTMYYSVFIYHLFSVYKKKQTRKQKSKKQKQKTNKKTLQQSTRMRSQEIIFQYTYSAKPEQQNFNLMKITFSHVYYNALLSVLKTNGTKGQEKATKKHNCAFIHSQTCM